MKDSKTVVSPNIEEQFNEEFENIFQYIRHSNINNHNFFETRNKELYSFLKKNLYLSNYFKYHSTDTIKNGAFFMSYDNYRREIPKQLVFNFNAYLYNSEHPHSIYVSIKKDNDIILIINSPNRLFSNNDNTITKLSKKDSNLIKQLIYNNYVKHLLTHKKETSRLQKIKDSNLNEKEM